MANLLFLENADEYRELIVEGARKRGYQSCGVSTAQETLRELRSKRYDALIIDPSEDVPIEGELLLSTIIRREFQEVRLIALTGHLETFFDRLATDSYHLIINKGHYETMDSLFHSISKALER